MRVFCPFGETCSILCRKAHRMVQKELRWEEPSYRGNFCCFQCFNEFLILRLFYRSTKRTVEISTAHFKLIQLESHGSYCFHVYRKGHNFEHETLSEVLRGSTQRQISVQLKSLCFRIEPSKQRSYSFIDPVFVYGILTYRAATINTSLIFWAVALFCPEFCPKHLQTLVKLLTNNVEHDWKFAHSRHLYLRIPA